MNSPKQASPALETIVSHRSIRKYRPDPIPQETLDSILQAATRASTSGNMQTYSIIVTRDDARRKELYRLHMEQEMILEAPLLLTFVADWNRMNRWCRLRDAEPGYDNFLCFLVALADAFIAAENAALAAESLGLGICYMGTTLCAAAELCAFFDLPEGVFPATTLVMGVPAEEPELRARLPISHIVHDERYRGFDDKRIANCYHDRETEGWERYMASPELRKAIERSGVKNLAQVYTSVKYVRENNQRFSKNLLALLKKQRFANP